jgi:hypothetical protein
MGTVAKYVFNNDANWDAAKNALSSQLNSGSYESSYFLPEYYIHITSECNDTSRAAQICSGKSRKTC